jgi:hypothetical protein
VSRQPNFHPACSAPSRQRSRRTASVFASSASSAVRDQQRLFEANVVLIEDKGA